MKLHHSFNKFKMEDVNFLTNLHLNIFDAGVSSDDSPISKGMILQFEKQIVGWDKVEFITGLFSTNIHSSYTLPFLFCFPELWVDFKLNDWLTVISKTKRIVPRPLGASEGCFSDIELLCRYLKIDGFQMLLLSDADIEDKRNVVSYFRMHPFLFNPDFSGQYLFNTVDKSIFSIFDRYNKDFLSVHTSINAFDVENLSQNIENTWKLLK